MLNTSLTTESNRQQAFPAEEAVVSKVETASDLGCTCHGDELVPFAKLDRTNTILRSYLAPPAAPDQKAISPLRTTARREAAGIGAAMFCFLLLVFLITLGPTLWVPVLAVVGGYVARALMWQLRVSDVRADEKILAEQARSQLEVYNSRRAAWERLSYCAKCRIVIDQVTGAARPLHLAHELLVVSSVQAPKSSTP